MNKIILSEVNNKLFLRRSNNLVNNQIVYKKNFIIANVKNFKMIKNIIEMELFAGQRPKITASFLKKSLIIDLKATKNNKEIYLLPWLQKNPVLWKQYISQVNLFDFYYIPPFLQQNRDKITFKFNKISKYQNWLKSAYLD